MATNKNITMKQFNGVDYDTLYPKTIASQVDDVYSKSETKAVITEAIAAADPMGPWKYGGKFTAMGSENKIEFHKVETGDTFSNVVNEFLIKINDIQTNYSATYEHKLSLNFQCTFTNGNIKNMNIAISDFTGSSSVYSLRGSIFRFNKIGAYGNNILYSPTSYTSDYSITKANNMSVPDDGHVWILSKMEVFLSWAYASNITTLDIDFYYR